MVQTPNSSVLADLALEMGLGKHTLEQCRQMVREHAPLIERELASAFTPSFRGIDARRAFAVLDASKALLPRRIRLQRQARALGWPAPDIILGLGSADVDIEEYLGEHPSKAVCSLYLAPDCETWCVFARAIPRRHEVTYDALRILAKSEAARFAKALRRYAESVVTGKPDVSLLETLLEALGARVLPAIKKLNITGSLVLIPHRLLHLLPLHCMSQRNAKRRTYLDECVQSISYASSLFEMRAPKIVAGRSGITDGEASILVVLDTASRELNWLKTQELYYEGLRQAGFPVEMVAAEDRMPTDLSPYVWVSWGGHAKSNPVDWGGSYMALGQVRYSAIDIALDWTCPFRPWVMLGVCGSALDPSEIGHIDEYCGIDLAVVMAGATGATSTMWPVKDALAALADIFVSQLVFFGQKEPAEALVLLQQRLRRGNWKQFIHVPQGDHPRELDDAFGSLLRLPEDAFQSFCDWGVFRCYGGA